MRKTEPPASTAVVAQTIGRGVTRSLYRSLLQEARKLDKATVSKVLLPIPRKLQVATGLTAPLYVPNGVKYFDLVKRGFRAHKPGEPGNPLLAFEALNMFRAHSKTVEGLLVVATREHENMVKALEDANPDTRQYFAKPILDPVQQQRIQQDRMDEELSKDRKQQQQQQQQKGQAQIHKSAPSSSSSVVTEPAAKGPEKIKMGVEAPPAHARSPRHDQTIRQLFSALPATRKSDALARLGTVEPKIGMGLVAHPLSSAHIDRRVILVVDTNPQTTTGLVLDMFYTYPLSHGNPMFPEVFWGHEVYNGGYCHVDFTMPPTANVSILHTLPAPSDTHTNSSYNARWLSWALGQSKSDGSSGGVGGGGGGSSKKGSGIAGTGSPTAHHERLCKPVIPGNGKDIPTLYYSKVEALPYLSSLVPGQPRSALRVYWGCMRWSTTQLTTEIKNGHWIPVDVSPKFFAAYPIVRPAAGGAAASGGAGGSGSGVGGGGGGAGDDGSMMQHIVDTFPTEEMLRESKDLRAKLLGADVVPPQTFPPDQPVCRRESLWDQIVLALGGEYKSLVGSVNPFVTKQHQQRAAAASGGGNGPHHSGDPHRLADPAHQMAPPPPPPLGDDDIPEGLLLESREGASIEGSGGDFDDGGHDDDEMDIDEMIDALDEEANGGRRDDDGNDDRNKGSGSAGSGKGSGGSSSSKPRPPSV